MDEPGRSRRRRRLPRAPRRRAGGGAALTGLVVAALVAALVVVTGPPASAGATPPRVPPVEGQPVRAYVAPPHEYGPGHRGVDLPAVAGQPVVAPADGTVTFAGPVAGRGVVVLEHADLTLTSLEPVVPLLAVGARVRAGRPVAELAGAPAHAGCPAGCLHWGIRVAGRYVDPWWWLGRTRPVRLLPLAGPPPVSLRAPPGPTGGLGPTRGAPSARAVPSAR